MRNVRTQRWLSLVRSSRSASGLASGWPSPAGADGARAQTACTQGADCTLLLAVQAGLEGTVTDALNWSADVPLAPWYGVKLRNGGVTKLEPVNKAMTGTLQAKLSELTQLTHLAARGAAETRSGQQGQIGGLRSS